MGYIYVMALPGETNLAENGYVGQSTGDTQKLKRIQQHVYKAYEVWPSEKESGASALIKTYGGSRIQTSIFDEASGYGFGPIFNDIYNEFKKQGWTTSDGQDIDSSDSKLTFAEIIWIISGLGLNLLGDISTFNKTIGDKKLFRYRLAEDETIRKLIRDAINNLEGNSALKKITNKELFDNKNSHDIGEAFITFGSTREDFLKIIDPKLYICKRAYQLFLRAYAFYGNKFDKTIGKLIRENLFINGDTNYNQLKVAAQEYLKECANECSEAWNRALIDSGLPIENIDGTIDLDFGSLAVDLCKFIKKNFDVQIVGSFLQTIQTFNEATQELYYLKIQGLKMNGKAVDINNLFTKTKKKKASFKAAGYSRADLQAMTNLAPQWFIDAIAELNTYVRSHLGETNAYYPITQHIFKQAAYSSFFKVYKETANPQMADLLDKGDNNSEDGNYIGSIADFMRIESLNFRLKMNYISKTKMKATSSTIIDWDDYSAECQSILRSKKNIEPLKSTNTVDGYVYSPYTDMYYKMPSKIWTIVDTAQKQITNVDSLRHY